ncbi:MAG: alkene reductase [Acidithiobacillus sp.]|nr:alkene reductase [Acidithiobacillus sp.]
MTDLFSPLTLGAIELDNRILMAPLTRCRAEGEHVPTLLMAEYYAQRASAGLIIAEATMILPGNSAFWHEPGIYSAEQIAGWRKVTDAVHQAGGKIALQIWHGGRACHPDLNNGAIPVAPSAIAIANEEVHTPKGKQAYTIPRALTDDEIPAIVEGFAQAARNARAAGFDMVEVHAANGYLIDEFLRDGSNHREGPYGGSRENRARFLFEVLDAVCAAIGADRVGVRFSPLNSFNDMKDSDPAGLYTWLANSLNDKNLAYLHLMRGDFYGKQTADVLTPVRKNYCGKLVVNMGYSPEEAKNTIAEGKADAVAFGTAFLANPDLPARIRSGATLNEPNPDTFYTPGPEGYTDYPTLLG